MAIIRFLSNVLTVFCILVLSQAAPLAEKAIAPTATLANGIVIGIATSIPNEPSNPALVNSYVGIPFAKSPPLRFAPPEPALPWTTPLQATKLKPACIQQFVGPKDRKPQNYINKTLNTHMNEAPGESEDCLYLNVYAPRSASTTNLKPVMFWIFGGNLMFGTASLGFYDGASLAVNQDVVVVTINYRTNIFGFSNSPELPKGSQNAGFLDQRLALQWVQDNIAQFGGDRSKVLLFGESAGAYSVKQLLANPPSPLPFAGAIMESQQSLAPFNGLYEWNRAIYNLNCAWEPSPLACLRGLPASQIKSSMEENFHIFGPVQEDGTSTADVRASITSGKFAKVPIFMGTNAQEVRVFLSLVGLENSTSLVDFMYGWSGADSSKSIDKLMAGLNKPFMNDTYLALDEILTDVIFNCPTSSLANHLASNAYSVWRYRFSGAFPNMAFFTKNPRQGAYHVSEIPQVFGTYLPDSTVSQIELSKIMQKLWANMARNPQSGPISGLQQLGESSTQVLELGDSQGSAYVGTVEANILDKDCTKYEGLGNSLGLLW